MNEINRNLCKKCWKVEWMVVVNGGRSVGQKWVTCEDCGERFLCEADDEPIVIVVNDENQEYSDE